ncbi:MAG: hypothetical protein H6732_19505 [Alphaproteobacteria bacterium]|nr:hypothetical protein [Alphaproteobacteria bacterium]
MPHLPRLVLLLALAGCTAADPDAPADDSADDSADPGDSGESGDDPVPDTADTGILHTDTDPGDTDETGTPLDTDPLGDSGPDTDTDTDTGADTAGDSGGPDTDAGDSGSVGDSGPVGDSGEPLPVDTGVEDTDTDTDTDSGDSGEDTGFDDTGLDDTGLDDTGFGDTGLDDTDVDDGDSGPPPHDTDPIDTGVLDTDLACAVDDPFEPEPALPSVVYLQPGEVRSFAAARISALDDPEDHHRLGIPAGCTGVVTLAPHLAGLTDVALAADGGPWTTVAPSARRHRVALPFPNDDGVLDLRVQTTDPTCTTPVEAVFVNCGFDPACTHDPADAPRSRTLVNATQTWATGVDTLGPTLFAAPNFPRDAADGHSVDVPTGCTLTFTVDSAPGAFRDMNWRIDSPVSAKLGRLTAAGTLTWTNEHATTARLRFTFRENPANLSCTTYAWTAALDCPSP